MTDTMTTTRYRLSIVHDEMSERPDEYAIGRMVSFNTRHGSYMHPDEINESDILATLSYFEHGLCRWMVGASTVPDYGGFDTVECAGVILWNRESDSREWWNGRTDDERATTLNAIAEEYTAWCNGEVFGYSLTELDSCGECGYTDTGTELDSCYGFVGSDYMRDHLTATLRDLDISLDDVEVTGGAAYVLG